PMPSLLFTSFFSNATSHSHTYTLSLHDALPISQDVTRFFGIPQKRIDVIHNGLNHARFQPQPVADDDAVLKYFKLDAPYFLYVADRKSTRLNSSHSQISYAVFCLKKKNKNK